MAQNYRSKGRKRSQPDTRIHNYNGPYNVKMLEESRKQLLEIVDSKDTVIWKRIRMKTGVFENGERDTDFSGWGKSSDIFSHSASSEIYLQPEPYLPEVEHCADDGPESNLRRLPGQSSATVSNEEFSGVSASNTVVPWDDLPKESVKVATNAKSNAKSAIENRDSPIKIRKKRKEIVIDLEELEDMKSIKVDKDNDDSVEILYATKITKRKSNKTEESSTVQISDVYESCDKDCLDSVEMDSFSYSDVQGPSVQGIGEINMTQVGVDSNVVILNKDSDQKQSVIYKCDFCETVCDDKNLMNRHLKTDIHFSASTYFADSDKKITSLKEKMTLMYKEAMYKTILVVCPLKSCNKVFPDIYQCAYHYKLIHDQFSEPMYSLVNIIDDEIFDLPVDPVKCFKCGEVFEDEPWYKFKLKRNYQIQGKLIKHYNKTGHFPFSSNENYAKWFKCPYCLNSSSFFPKLIQAPKHLARHNKTVVDGVHHLRVIYYEEKSPFKLSSMRCKEAHTVSTSAIKENLEGKVNETNKMSAAQSKQKIESTNKVVVKQEFENNSADNEIKMDENSADHNDLFVIDRVPSKIVDADEKSHGSTPSTSSNGVAVGDNEDICEEVEDISNDLNSSDLRYKCDYCATISDNGQRMHHHLKEKHHSSASTVLVRSNGKVQFMVTKLSIRCKEADFHAVIAVCPNENCHQIFSDIYMCSEHFNMCHDPGSEPVYGLANIVKEMTVMCPQRPLECKVCGERFDKRKYLNHHFEKNNHFPFVGNTGDCDVYYCCMYCLYNVHSFKQISNHTALKHDSKAVHGEFVLRVIFLSRDRVKKRIPPYPKGKKCHFDYLRSRILSLKTMKKVCGKQQRMRIKKEIKDLKQFLSINTR